MHDQNLDARHGVEGLDALYNAMEDSPEKDAQRGQRQGKREKSLPIFVAALPFAPDFPLTPPSPHKSRKPRQRCAAGKVAAHAKTRRKIAGQSRRKNRKNLP